MLNYKNYWRDFFVKGYCKCFGWINWIFFNKALFIIGGGISFLFLAAYVIRKLNQNDKMAITVS